MVISFSETQKQLENVWMVMVFQITEFPKKRLGFGNNSIERFPGGADGGSYQYLELCSDDAILVSSLADVGSTVLLTYPFHHTERCGV